MFTSWERWTRCRKPPNGGSKHYGAGPGGGREVSRLTMSTIILPYSYYFSVTKESSLPLRHSLHKPWPPVSQIQYVLYIYP